MFVCFYSCLISSNDDDDDDDGGLEQLRPIGKKKAKQSKKQQSLSSGLDLHFGSVVVFVVVSVFSCPAALFSTMHTHTHSHWSYTQDSIPPSICSGLCVWECGQIHRGQLFTVDNHQLYSLFLLGFLSLSLSLSLFIHRFACIHINI